MTPPRFHAQRSYHLTHPFATYVHPAAGLSVADTSFAVWSGKSARVYRVDSALSNVEPLEPFVCPARAIAIVDTAHSKDEALFAAEVRLYLVYLAPI